MIGNYALRSTLDSEELDWIETDRQLEKDGLRNVRWYIDDDYDLNRPAFRHLQADVSAGMIQAIVASSFSSISPSLLESANTIYDWVNRGIRVFIVGGSYDFFGEAGKSMAQTFLSMAEKRQQERHDRQAAGIARAKQQGKYKGRQPGSFKASPSRARELRSQGLTDNEIASALKVTRRTVQRYLKG